MLHTWFFFSSSGISWKTFSKEVKLIKSKYCGVCCILSTGCLGDKGHEGRDTRDLTLCKCSLKLADTLDCLEVLCPETGEHSRLMGADVCAFGNMGLWWGER